MPDGSSCCGNPGTQNSAPPAEADGALKLVEGQGIPPGSTGCALPPATTRRSTGRGSIRIRVAETAERPPPQQGPSAQHLIHHPWRASLPRPQNAATTASPPPAPHPSSGRRPGSPGRSPSTGEPGTTSAGRCRACGQWGPPRGHLKRRRRNSSLRRPPGLRRTGQAGSSSPPEACLRAGSVSSCQPTCTRRRIHARHTITSGTAANAQTVNQAKTGLNAELTPNV